MMSGKKAFRSFLVGFGVLMLAATLFVLTRRDTRPGVFERVQRVKIENPEVLKHLNGQLWIANDRVFIYGRDATRLDVEEIDLKSNSHRTNELLSTVLSKAGDPTNSEGIEWFISMDGTTLAIVRHEDDGGDTVETIDTQTFATSTRYRVAGGGWIEAFHWIPGSQRWLVFGHSKAATTVAWQTLGGEVAEANLNFSNGFPAGCFSDGSVLFISMPDADLIRGREFQLLPTPKLNRTWTAEVPHGSWVQMATISPDGSHILWYLARTDLLGIHTERSFPFLSVSRRVTASIWTSRADGSHWVFLGEVPSNAALGGVFEWLPDSLRVSALVGGELWIVPAVIEK